MGQCNLFRLQSEVKPLRPDGARIESQFHRKSMKNHQVPRRVPHTGTTLLGQAVQGCSRVSKCIFDTNYERKSTVSDYSAVCCRSEFEYFTLDSF